MNLLAKFVYDIFLRLDVLVSASRELHLVEFSDLHMSINGLGQYCRVLLLLVSILQETSIVQSELRLDIHLSALRDC